VRASIERRTALYERGRNQPSRREGRQRAADEGWQTALRVVLSAALASGLVATPLTTTRSPASGPRYRPWSCTCCGSSWTRIESSARGVGGSEADPAVNLW